MAYCLTSLSPDGVGEVDSLFVAPLYRRSGVGSKLLQRALDWLGDSGAVSQRVVVLHANTEAESFYRRFGFHPRNIELEHLPKARILEMKTNIAHAEIESDIARCFPV
ncbi:MAG: GNAT family N-acetyltransferase, partial [Chthoniobacteraceae bacterium]